MLQVVAVEAFVAMFIGRTAASGDWGRTGTRVGPRYLSSRQGHHWVEEVLRGFPWNSLQGVGTSMIMNFWHHFLHFLAPDHALALTQGRHQ